MDEALVSKVFDPFFTTKRNGTGLGLATVHNVVEAAEGLVTIESAPGEGTTVRVYLPSVEETETLADDSTSRPEASETFSATIMVVEDSSGVRQLMVDVLREAGHTVLEAGDGEEGLRTAETAPDSVDLVVTDVVMPRMRGPEMVALLRAGHPHLKVLYVSGHLSRGLEGIDVESADTHLLPKPFEPQDLLRRVGELLSRNRLSAPAKPMEPA